MGGSGYKVSASMACFAIICNIYLRSLSSPLPTPLMASSSRQYLRFFSIGGNQGQVLSFDGDLVTMIGRSRFVAIIYHESNPMMDGTQKLGYTLFDALTSLAVSKGSVSGISKGASLSWAGFSDDSSLVVMDTDGVLSMLICATSADNMAEPFTRSSWAWAPVLDTLGLHKSSDDCFWPVAVQEGKLVFVPLKGGNRGPSATARPITATLNLRLPLARRDSTDEM